MLWLPAACGLLGALLAAARGAPARDPRGAAARAQPSAPSERVGAAGRVALLGSLAALGLAIGYIADYTAGRRGLQHVTDVVWISELGIHYKLAIDGLNVFLVGLTTLLFAAAMLAANLRTVASARGSSTSTSCSPSPPCSARSSPRTSRCSSRSST